MENQERSEKVSFDVGKAVSGKFTFSSPLTGDSMGTDGKTYTWHMYKFIDSVDQREKVFFASKALNEMLNEKGDLEGKSFKITKVVTKDENGNIVEKNGRIFTNFEVETDDSISAKDAGMDQI